jgi:hypothetical protein
MHLLRTNAPGWLPELHATHDGDTVHKAPGGGYLLIGFSHIDGHHTPPVPQAIMDNKNNSIPYDKITARDITDTHRRGVCMAAALTFGLAYELWAKMPLETGYADEAKPEQSKPVDHVKTGAMAGMWEAMPEEKKDELRKIAITITEYMDAEDPKGALAFLDRQDFSIEERTALWTRLSSKTRTALKVTRDTVEQLSGAA